MTFHHSTIRRILIGAALALAPACVNVFGLSPEVKLPISELVTPATATPQGPVTVTLTVVTGGCRSFDRIEAKRTGSVILLEAWGRDGSSGAVACTDDIRYEPHSYTLTGPFTDPLVISAVQPDGTSITKTVKVQ